MTDMTNKKFAEASTLFRKACELAGIEPTSRQASRFLNGSGAARKFYNAARKELLDAHAKTKTLIEINKPEELNAPATALCIGEAAKPQKGNV